MKLLLFIASSGGSFQTLILQQSPDSLLNYFFCIKYPQGDTATSGSRKATSNHCTLNIISPGAQANPFATRLPRTAPERWSQPLLKLGDTVPFPYRGSRSGDQPVSPDSVAPLPLDNRIFLHFSGFKISGNLLTGIKTLQNFT